MNIQADDKIISENSNWKFDENVAPNFDKHVRKSVPSYDKIQALAESFSDWFSYPNSTIVDLGSATGETLKRISKRHTKPLKLIGYDNSTAMIKQAKRKGIDITFEDLEFEDVEFPKFSYGLALYTLQFLLPTARKLILEKMYESLEENGAIFVVEKIKANTALTQDILQSLYWEMKSKNGFSAEQIMNKSKALRGCMHLKTIDENEDEFGFSGFNYEVVFKETLFCGWLLTK